MSVCECVLVVLLLTSPPDSSASRLLASLAGPLRPALIEAAIAAEVLDPREPDRFAGEEKDVAAELAELQMRYQSLADSGHLYECRLFPPRRLANELLLANRDYLASLKVRLALDAIHRDELRQAMAENEELYQIWRLVRDAQDECYYIVVRRRALRELRNRIGVEAYGRAQLPPFVPVWHLPAWR
jgi:hypothetical protein